jgi:hypothetical protein
MSQTILREDADILPPMDGSISQVTMVAATATAAQDTGVTGATIALGSQFVTFMSTAEFYIVFSNNGTSTITAPVVTTATCWGPFPSGTQVALRVNPTQRYFRAISTPGGILKWYRSNGPGEV